MGNAIQRFISDKSTMLGTAFVLILLSFFLLTFGVRGIPWLYWTGIILLSAGLLLAPLSRYTAEKKEEKKEDDKEKDGEVRSESDKDREPKEDKGNGKEPTEGVKGDSDTNAS